MPMPKPKPNEAKDKFLDRCMGDVVMVRDYSDNKQRYAVCNSLYDKKEKDMGEIKITDNDFKDVDNKSEVVEDMSDMIIIKMVDDKDIKFDDTIILTISDRKGITALFDEKKRKILAYFFDKTSGFDELRAKEWLKENKNYSGETEVESFKFFKKDTEQRIVYGAVLVPYEVDLQGDIETPEEIEKAAHKFLSGFQTIGDMHEKFKGIGNLLESSIAQVDFMLNGVYVKKGSWVIATKVVEDDVWDKIKKGELTGYSIGYSATRVSESV